MTPFSLACSPCPNDTFLFHGLATGKVPLPVPSFRLHLADIETLNQEALVARHDLTKLSAHAWLLTKSHYTPLATGAALGFGCGPLLLSHHPLLAGEVEKIPILFPGPLTTAYLLFRLFYPRSDPGLHHFAPYNQTPGRIASGEFHAGVVIHESRFHYDPLTLVADLGTLWEEETQLPVPLGLCVARSHFSPDFRQALDQALAASLDRACSRVDPDLAAFIRHHACEQDPALMEQQIKTFVTEQTHSLGEVGFAALAAMERLARERGVLHD